MWSTQRVLWADIPLLDGGQHVIWHRGFWEPPRSLPVQKAAVSRRWALWAKLLNGLVAPPVDFLRLIICEGHRSRLKIHVELEL